MEAGADISRHDTRAVDDGHDHLCDIGAVLRAFLEHFDQQPIELEDSAADLRLDLELPMLAGAAAYIEEAGSLVVAVMDAPVERGLEAVTDAGYEHGFADHVEGFGFAGFRQAFLPLAVPCLR